MFLKENLALPIRILICASIGNNRIIFVCISTQTSQKQIRMLTRLFFKRKMYYNSLLVLVYFRYLLRYTMIICLVLSDELSVDSMEEIGRM